VNAYKLPTSLRVGEVDYKIRTDFDEILNILEAMNDPDLPDEGKGIVLIVCLYEKWRDIPQELYEEAILRGNDFIDHGLSEDDGKPQPKLMDWQQDANLIVPAVNAVAHTDIRLIDHLHWWTFLDWFMEIRESLFSNVLSIRQKKAKHKKLEKHEQEFYREHRALIELRARESEEVKQEKDNLLKWL
jgi:hypothetical protein